MIEKSLKSTKTFEFEDYLLLGLSNLWKSLNNDNQLVFDVKILNGKLILCANLARLQSTKEVDTNGK